MKRRELLARLIGSRPRGDLLAPAERTIRRTAVLQLAGILLLRRCPAPRHPRALPGSQQPAACLAVALGAEEGTALVLEGFDRASFGHCSYARRLVPATESPSTAKPWFSGDWDDLHLLVGARRPASARRPLRGPASLVADWHVLLPLSHGVGGAFVLEWRRKERLACAPFASLRMHHRQR